MKNKILIRNIYRLNLQIFLKKTNPSIYHKDIYFVKSKSNRQRTGYMNFIFSEQIRIHKTIKHKAKKIYYT